MCFPCKFQHRAIRKRKGRFSVSVPSAGTAPPTHLIPKGCSNRALIGVAPGNSPSSQSCQSSDFSDARRNQCRNPTTHEKTKSQAFKKATGTLKTLLLPCLKQSSGSKAHPSSVSPLHQCGQGVCKAEARPIPFLSHFLPR